MNALRPGLVLDSYTLQDILRADANRSVWVACEAYRTSVDLARIYEATSLQMRIYAFVCNQPML